MLKKSLLLIILSFSRFIFSQEVNFDLLKDTAIYFDELTFHSEIEKEKFKAIYYNQSQDYFSLFFLSNKDADNSKVEKSKQLLQQQTDIFKTKKKDDKKMLKWIYKEVHDEFFIKYERQNNFDDVFEKGYFNCVSSTAIYCIIFDKLAIPYQINLMPEHVNLTAFPKTHNILIEATNPVSGYVTYDKKFKEEYVDHLIKYKMVDENEVALKSVDLIFEEYFSNITQINLRQLVGVQYYNDGLYLNNEDKIEESIIQFEKSMALYPSMNTAKILLSIYSKELIDSDYSDIKHFNYLVRASRYKEVSEDFEKIVESEYGRIADESLLQKGDTTLFKKMYNEIKPLLTNQKAITNVDFIYTGAMGDYHLKEMNYKKAENYFLQALKLVGDTHQLEDFYIKSVVLQISDKSDMEDALLRLENAQKKYEPIKDNKIFLTAKAEVITLLMMRRFERNRIKEGNKYRVMLESLLENEDVKRNENNIGIAYAQAGSAYFRMGSTSKAKELFKKGLTYAPGNYELEYRLKMISY